MKPFQGHRGLVAPLNRENVDTDQIIPKQHLKSIARTGFGTFLFSDWRYHESGAEKPGFVLNQDAYRQATVLVAGKNFGCGSSREHAAWALVDFGIRAVIAPSFADIFRANAGNNGLLLIEQPQAVIDYICRRAGNTPGYAVSIDLEAQTLADDQGLAESFVVEPFRRHRLLNGLDEIGMTLQHDGHISGFERKHVHYITRPQNL
jgi:3-isopropylmalate/(R)-2-methylmalate dehydratase small subunit